MFQNVPNSVWHVNFPEIPMGFWSDIHRVQLRLVVAGHLHLHHVGLAGAQLGRRHRGPGHPGGPGVLKRQAKPSEAKRNFAY